MANLKKLLCMALCLTTMSSFVGCDSIRGVFGGDSSKDSVSNSTSETTSEDTGIKENEALEEAESYYNGVLKTVEEMQSFHIEATFEGLATSKFIGADGKVDESKTQESPITLEFVADVSGEAVKFTATNINEYTTEDENGKTTVVQTSVMEQIITVEYTYEHSYYYDDAMTEAAIAEAKASPWYKMSTTVGEDISDEINEMLAGVPVELIQKLLATKEVKDLEEAIVEGVKGSIADMILDGSIKDGVVSYENAYADDVNAIITYLENIDENKDKLGKVINLALAQVVPGLTVEALIGQVKAYSAMTVKEALDSIDNMLATNYTTSLQDIKDAVVNSEIAGVLFTDVFAFDADMIKQIKDWKVDSLKNGEYKDIVLGDLINQLLVEAGAFEAPAEGEEMPDYLAQLLAQVEAVLNMTLAELEIEIPSFAGIDITTIDEAWSVKFNKDYWIESINGQYDVELTVENMNSEGVVTDYTTAVMTLAIAIEEISDKAVAIALPAEKDVINVLTLSGAFDEAGTLTIESDRYGLEGTLVVTDENGESYTLAFYNWNVLNDYGAVEVYVDYIQDYGTLTDETMTAVSTYYQDNWFEFTLTLNENGTYTVDGLPTIAEMVEWYNTEYNVNA